MSRRVLVVGLRATGEAVTRHFTAAGDRVTVVDEAPGAPGYAARRATVESLGALVVESPAAGAWLDLVAHADLVVPSPGVRPWHPVFTAAAETGVPVRGDVDVAVEVAPAPVIAVTGTNGKSTVTTLAASMLQASGLRAVAAGNIGYPLLDALTRPADVFVAEVSSFQLHTTTATFAPHVAVLLNVADDHRDWHGSFEAYAAAKARVFAHQRPSDVLVANRDDPVVTRLVASAAARVVGFTLRPEEGEYRVAHGRLLTADGEELVVVGELTQRAPHDLANALAAAAAAQAAGATVAGIAGALHSARRLHHRTEPVGQAGGVTFVDDSKATNPHAALAALRGYEHVVLIAGGDAKGVDLGPLATEAARVRAVVAIGDRPDQVEAAFAHADPPVEVVRAATMEHAVATAARLARPGDTVLLSPACASFDWFDSYEHRGRSFVDAVAALCDHGAPE